MPATAEPPAATETTTQAQDGIAQGAPSTGARPSSFRPPNPAFEAVAKRMSSRLESKAVTADGKPASRLTPAKPDPASTEAPATIPKPDESESGTAQENAGTDTDAGNGEPKQDQTKTEEGKETQAPEARKEKKVSPWRLVDDYKKTNSELKARLETYEKELGELKGTKPAAEVPKDVTERLSKAEARVKELEDDLRFTDYQRHPEFVTKYQKPYNDAWKLATSELSEVAITDPNTGAQRPATAEDMLALVNLPLGQAREYANKLFGEFADDAMGHRKEIKRLFDAQQNALKEARENGATHAKQVQEQTQAQRQQVDKAIKDTWESAKREVVTHEKHSLYLNPVEGDQKGNAALAKGIEFADKAFSANPRDPSLSSEQRKEVVRMHAALMYRAAAYPRMRQWIEERDARIKELQERLDGYAESEPGQAAGTSTSTASENGKPSNPFIRFQQRLEKRAHK